MQFGESDVPSTSPQSQAGAAYILKNDGGINNWTQIQRIQSSFHSAGDLFGMQVAINGKYVFVSATGNTSDASEQNAIYKAGAAFIFMDNTPLPVTLSSFEAKKSENQAILKWTTSSEANSDYFEIQKSSDGNSWKSIGNVEAAEDSEKLKTYTFIDGKPHGGENLYRLKMVDRDTTFTYSATRSLSFDGLGIAVFPNPVSDKIFFTQSELSKIESVGIVNSQGKVLIQNAKVSEHGISISHLSAGMYLVQIKKTDGSIQTNKIFIAR